MSILSQFTASSVTTAFQSAIERPGLTYQLAGNSAGGADTPMDFALGRTTDGDIQITFRQSIGVRGLVPFRLHATITASIRFKLNAVPARQNVLA